MATKAELQSEIDAYNAQINTLKNDLVSLNNDRPTLLQSSKDLITSFNKDFSYCSPVINLSDQALLSGQAPNFDSGICHKDPSLFDHCSVSGCASRINSINSSLASLNQNISSTKSKNDEITRLLNLISGLNAQILALPESQAQIQSAVVSAATLADATKKKWLIFGAIVLVIVIGSVFVYIRVKK